MHYLFLIFALLMGCSDRDEAWEFRKILDTGIRDGGSDTRTDFSCQEHLLQEDFYHCGECENQCNSSIADQCFGGMCSCGELGPCKDGNRCWKGTCYGPDPGEVCEADSDCPSFRRNCIEGRCQTINCGEFEVACPDNYLCIQNQCTAVECVPEVCDGLDNDCDGEVDSTGGNPLAEFCYSGPDISNIKPPCAKGIRICEGGAWSPCMNEIPPVPEQGLLGCDGLDNNCDGCVDGILEDNMCVSAEPNSFDIVYLIDTSGSMSRKIEAVKMATDSFSSKFSGNSAFKFGLISVPYVLDDDTSTTKIDLTSYAQFIPELGLITSDGGAEEGQWDVVHDLGTGDLPMRWTEGSTRIIVVFTDEEGQSYKDTPITEAQMCSALTRGEVLASVVLPIHSEDFDDCGLTFELTEDPLTMASQLDTIISDPCK